MKIDINAHRRYESKIAQSRGDRLIEFFIHPLIEEFEASKVKNIQYLFTLCKQVGVRYIYIAPGEIVGCEDIKVSGWPAIWEIARRLELDTSCGNSDQYQIHDLSKILFPIDSYGAWDVTNNIKLTLADHPELMFRFVVTDQRNRL